MVNTIFFILSKIFNFIFSPYSWIFALLIWALLTKNPTKRKKLLWISVAIFYIFSNSFLLDEVMRLWEKPVVTIDSQKQHYTYVVVLGGMMSYYDTKAKQIGFNKSVDRLMQGLKILNKGIADTLVFSGGDGSVLKSIGPEGDYIKNYLGDIAFDTSCVKVESKSQNTYENAKYSSTLIKSDKNHKILLITSAFHLRRAIGCFEKQGFVIDYYPADRISGKRKFTFDHLLIPQIEAMEKWSVLIHEISGYIIYKIMGYL
ncbi:MAG: YdcF family protein [Bacteroidales bacterium]